MENETPWWLSRCTHNQHDVEACWHVLREAEGVAILLLTCLDSSWSAVHICVELAGVGSSCQPISFQQYKEMTEPQLMSQVQQQWKELRSLNQMP